MEKRIGTWGISVWRGATVLWSGLLCLLFLSGLPIYYRYLLDDCTREGCAGASIGRLPADLQLQWGLSQQGLALSYAGFDLFCFLIYAACACVILSKRSREPIALISSLLLVSFAFITLYPDSLLMASVWEPIRPVHRTADATAFLSVFLFGLLFPNGGLPRRWMTIAGLAVFIPRFLATYAPKGWSADSWPAWLTITWMILFYGLLIFVQIYRYRYAADVRQREQTRLFVVGFCLMIISVFTVNLLPLAWQPDLYQTRDPGTMLTIDVLNRLLSLLLPVTLTVSVLRYRLWNIEPIVNRTLLYVSLSGCIVGLYIGAVWYLGTIFRIENHVVVSLVATGLVAVVFAPLKERMQNGLNRLMYGEKEDPYAVLLRLGRRLKEPHRPEEAMQLIVKTVCDTLKLSYVALKLHHRNGGFAAVAEVGSASADGAGLEELPLVMNGEELGLLLVGRRPSGDPIEGQQRKLLELLVRQACVVVSVIKQTLDIQLLVKDLRESRERLILAREEERLSIRRNLHDDLAPKLAALALNAESAEEFMKRDPVKAAVIVSGLKTVIRETVNDIRGLVYELRPPALDELGLVGAVRQKISELQVMAAVRTEAPAGQACPLEFVIEMPDEPLPPLPAAVEVAAYRILSEAVLNCVKHAQAALCSIRIAIEEGNLQLTITDDGIGFSADKKHIASYGNDGNDMSLQAGKGVGLASMSERATELGGRLTVMSPPSGGTTIQVWIPLSSGAGKEQRFDDDSDNDTRASRG